MSARDDYRCDGLLSTHAAMCDEIDRLRLDLAYTDDIARCRGEENERLRMFVSDRSVPRPDAPTDAP